MQLFLCFDLIDCASDGIDDESMSSFSCQVRSRGDAFFEIVIQTNGGCRHGQTLYVHCSTVVLQTLSGTFSGFFGVARPDPRLVRKAF